jgi:hypothetical protein
MFHIFLLVQDALVLPDVVFRGVIGACGVSGVKKVPGPISPYDKCAHNLLM